MNWQRYIMYYERGHLTALEVADRLCHLRDINPVEFGAEIPAAILALVRERVANIPEVEEVFPIAGIGSPGSTVGSPEYRAEQDRIVAGLRTWKAYFESVERVIGPLE